MKFSCMWCYLLAYRPTCASIIFIFLFSHVLLSIRLAFVSRLFSTKDHFTDFPMLMAKCLLIVMSWVFNLLIIALTFIKCMVSGSIFLQDWQHWSDAKAWHHAEREREKVKREIFLTSEMLLFINLVGGKTKRFFNKCRPTGWSREIASFSTANNSVGLLERRLEASCDFCYRPVIFPESVFYGWKNFWPLFPFFPVSSALKNTLSVWHLLPSCETFRSF